MSLKVAPTAGLAVCDLCGARVATLGRHGHTHPPPHRLVHCRPAHRHPRRAASPGAGRRQGQRRRELQAWRSRTVSGRHDRQSRARAEQQQPVRPAAATDIWRTGREERVVLRRNRRAESGEDASRRQEHSTAADSAGRVRRAPRRRRLHARCGADVHPVLAQRPSERSDLAADRLWHQHLQRQHPDAVHNRSRHRLPGARLFRREPPRYRIGAFQGFRDAGSDDAFRYAGRVQYTSSIQRPASSIPGHTWARRRFSRSVPGSTGRRTSTPTPPTRSSIIRLGRAPSPPSSTTTTPTAARR